MNTWNFQLAVGVVPHVRWPKALPEISLTVSTESTKYDDGVKAIFQNIQNDPLGDTPITVRIWRTGLTPNYGPYYYTRFMKDGVATYCQTCLYPIRDHLVSTNDAAPKEA